MKKFEDIIDYIEKSYLTSNFDLNYFEFYKTRKEKRKNSVGILNWNGEKYFFKIIKQDEYNDEDEIKNKISPYFKIVEKYSERKMGDQTINLYQYIDAPKENAFNFLRNKDISIEEKEAKLTEFFNKKIELMNKTCVLTDMTGTKKADRWFIDRITTDNRLERFYGKDAEKLLEDIKNIYKDGYSNYEQFFENIFTYLEKENKTVESYCHGDFHDFNFSLDGLFWDVDTFGMNPILNDFAVYYWHFYGREDTFVYKYSPWLTNYMYDTLSKTELDEVRNLKEKFISIWYDDIEKLYEKYNIIDGIKEEFIFKLFCRTFLIGNILEYEEEERKMVYEFFDYYLENKETPLRELLFTNPVKFPYGGK